MGLSLDGRMFLEGFTLNGLGHYRINSFLEL